MDDIKKISKEQQIRAIVNALTCYLVINPLNTNLPEDMESVLNPKGKISEEGLISFSIYDPLAETIKALGSRGKHKMFYSPEHREPVSHEEQYFIDKNQNDTLPEESKYIIKDKSEIETPYWISIGKNIITENRDLVPDEELDINLENLDLKARIKMSMKEVSEQKEIVTPEYDKTFVPYEGPPDIETFSFDEKPNQEMIKIREDVEKFINLNIEPSEEDSDEERSDIFEIRKDKKWKKLKQ